MASGRPGEPETAMEACADYLAMPKKERSLEELARRYAAADDPPTRSLHTLKNWSEKYGWQERLRVHTNEKNALVLQHLKESAAGITAQNAQRILGILDALDDPATRALVSAQLKPGDVKGLVETLQKLVGAPLVDKTQQDLNVNGTLTVNDIDSLSPETRQAMIADLTPEADDDER